MRPPLLVLLALPAAACQAYLADRTAEGDERSIRLADGLRVRLLPGAPQMRSTPRGSSVSIPVGLGSAGTGTYYVVSTNRGIRTAFEEGESVASLPVSSEHAVLHMNPGGGLCSFLSIGDLDVRKFRVGEPVRFLVGSDGADRRVGMCFAREVELQLSTGASLPVGSRMEAGCASGGAEAPSLEVIHSGVPSGSRLAELRLDGSVCTVLSVQREAPAD